MVPCPWRLSELKLGDVRQTTYAVAVLPIGATEPHNLHLPYGIDTLNAEMIADECCRRAHERGARVVLLPSLPYGVDTNQMGFPLAMNVYQSTLNRIVRDLIESVERHGIRKFVLFNGHGGNSFKPLLRDLYGNTTVFISLVDWWRVGGDQYYEIFAHRDNHGGEMETSIALHHFPELVDMSLADAGNVRRSRFTAVNAGWVDITRPWHLLTTDAGVGDPRQGTADKGQRYVDLVASRVADYLVELAAAEMDDLFPMSHRPHAPLD